MTDQRAPVVEPLSHPIMLELPRRLTNISSWHGHIPFAMYLVDAIRPATFVELGTHYGDSYCAFCQAVDVCGTSTACFAIDTWTGDPQTGFYSDEVLSNLRSHHDPLYGSFSRLVQATFDEAARTFEDQSIDLLHVDGYHTYEAVTHDLETWRPKLSERGVVLLHDTNVRNTDFGAWHAWDDLVDRHPHFEFLHSHGLGVIAVGNVIPDPVLRLVEADGEQIRCVRSLFGALGARVELTKAHSLALGRIEDLEGTLRRHEDELRRHEDELQTIERERDASNAALTATRASAEAREAENAERTAELERRASIAEVARASVQADLEARLGGQEQLLAEVFGSKSWRITAPLRRVAGPFR